MFGKDLLRLTIKAFATVPVLYILLLLAAIPAIAGENYNQVVTAKNDAKSGVLEYSWSFTMTDSTGNYYTKAMRIDGIERDKDGTLETVCSEVGTENVDVFAEYSSDLKTWIAGTTDADLDALGTTQVSDTVGVSAGIDQKLTFRTLKWMRYKYAGQSGNQQTTVSGRLTLRKPAQLFKERVSGVAKKK